MHKDSEKAVVIVHTNKGGAYRVAQFYAETLNATLLIKPGYLDIFKLCCRKNSLALVIFNNIKYAFRYTWLIRLLSKNTSIYNVEHYVLTQLLKNEIVDKFKIRKFLFKLYLCRLLSVQPIVLDEYCQRNRKKIISGDSKIIYNPLLSSTKSNPTKGYKYDVVWSGRLDKYKIWSKAINLLKNLSSSGYKVAVVSYDHPSHIDKQIMDDCGIDFFYDFKNWTELSEVYFFSSIFEGYPLSLIEAISSDKKIIAWCDTACYFQILKKGGCSLFYSSKFDDIDITNAIEKIKTAKSLDTNYLLNRHKPEFVRKKILQLK